MENLKNANWWACAIVRALKTICQTLVAMIGTSTMASQIDWKVVLSSTALAGLLSILTSIAGLPEVTTSEEAKG